MIAVESKVHGHLAVDVARLTDQKVDDSWLGSESEKLVA
jgi:hypothetical protein